MKKEDIDVEKILYESAWITIREIHRYFRAHQELLSDEDARIAYEYNRENLFRRYIKRHPSVTLDDLNARYDLMIDLDNKMHPERAEEGREEALHYIKQIKGHKEFIIEKLKKYN